MSGFQKKKLGGFGKYKITTAWGKKTIQFPQTQVVRMVHQLWDSIADPPWVKTVRDSLDPYHPLSPLIKLGFATKERHKRVYKRVCSLEHTTTPASLGYSLSVFN